MSFSSREEFQKHQAKTSKHSLDETEPMLDVEAQLTNPNDSGANIREQTNRSGKSRCLIT